MIKYKFLGLHSVLADGWILCRNYGDDLKVGDFFTHIFESELVVENDTAWCEIREKGTLKNPAGSVFITEIKVFGKKQDFLASGYTGEIRISTSLPILDDTFSLGDNKTKTIHDYRLRRK